MEKIKNIIRDKNLKPNERLIMVALISNSIDGHISKPRLCSQLNLSEQVVDNSIKRLMELGFVERGQRVHKAYGFSHYEYVINPNPNGYVPNIYKEEKRDGYSGIGYVYVIQADKFYKIGISKTPKRRIKQYTEMPYEIKEILFERINGYQELEYFLHNHFENKRIRGEWFSLNSDDLDFIKLQFEKHQA